MTFEEAIKKAMIEQASKKELFILEQLKPAFDYDEKTNTATLKEFMRLRFQSIEEYKTKVKKVIERLQPKEVSGVYKGTYADVRDSYEYFLALEELKKELELDDTLFGMKIKTDSRLKENEFRLER